MSSLFLLPSRFARSFSLAPQESGVADSFCQPRRVTELGALSSGKSAGLLSRQGVPASKQGMLLALSRHTADFQMKFSEWKGTELLELLSGRSIPAGAFAYNYGGHQFGTWAGQLGDGRALVLGEAQLNDGSRVELQLKGSGMTPFSRRGDGLAVLRSSVREFLMSEAMFSLGIPTSRALSLFLTGERVLRDRFYDGRPEFEPGAIVCRTAPTFLRFGNFELLAERGQHDDLRSLIRFSAAEFCDLNSQTDEMSGAMDFVHAVSARTAELVAAWQSVGFVHGVLNTDNMSIAGLTIDYGPFGVMDEFDPAYTPNTSDLPGRRYCYANQPRICRWNVAMFAQAIGSAFGWSRFIAGDLEGSPIVEAAMATFDQTFQREIMRRWQVRLGYEQQPEQEAAQARSINELLRLLQKYRLDLNYVLREYSEALRAGDSRIFMDSMGAYGRILLSEDALGARAAEWVNAFVSDWDRWLELDLALANQSEDLLTKRGQSMCQVNPRFVLHNHHLAQLSERLSQRIAQGKTLTNPEDPGAEIQALLAVLYSPFDDSVTARKLATPLGLHDRRVEDCLNSCSS